MTTTQPGGQSKINDPTEWALLNLILCILGALLAVFALIRAFFWSKNKEYDRYVERRMVKPIWIILAIVMAIVGFVVLFLTEDMRLPITFVDIWTVLNAAIFIAGIICVMLAFKKEKEDYHQTR
jgi:cytochrome bd-type quinol oxidase subunit 2